MTQESGRRDSDDAQDSNVHWTSSAEFHGIIETERAKLVRGVKARARFASTTEEQQLQLDETPLYSIVEDEVDREDQRPQTDNNTDEQRDNEQDKTEKQDEGPGIQNNDVIVGENRDELQRDDQQPQTDNKTDEQRDNEQDKTSTEKQDKEEHEKNDVTTHEGDERQE